MNSVLLCVIFNQLCYLWGPKFAFTYIHTYIHTYIYIYIKKKKKVRLIINFFYFFVQLEHGNGLEVYDRSHGQRFILSMTLLRISITVTFLLTNIWRARVPTKVGFLG